MSSNLLEEWYKNALISSSHLNISPKYPRGNVEFIYNKIKFFFSDNFFILKKGEDLSINKVSWIHGLLSNADNNGCYSALYDVAKLIEYIKTLDESIQNEAHKLKRNPENLRTFFFELYIYRFLDKFRIQNKKKQVVSNQIIEGTFTLEGQEFLFECRKIFFPRINELDILRHLATIFYKSIQSMQKGHGLICTIELKRPIQGKHRSMDKVIIDYFKNLNANDEANSTVEIEGIGIFNAIKYDQINLFEIETKKNYDVLLKIIPPSFQTNGLNKFHSNIEINFSVSQDYIYKKIEGVLKEKKQQHKNSPFKNKILFIDSESLPEFQQGIFQHEEMFDNDRLATVYKKICPEIIICVIRRFYLGSNPKISTHIYCHDLKYKTVVENLQKKLEDY